jgi:hypothetical protein
MPAHGVLCHPMVLCHPTGLGYPTVLCHSTVLCHPTLLCHPTVLCRPTGLCQPTVLCHPTVLCQLRYCVIPRYSASPPYCVIQDGNRPEAAVLDVLWGGNRELTGRNPEVWPHAPYVMQSWTPPPGKSLCREKAPGSFLFLERVVQSPFPPVTGGGEGRACHLLCPPGFKTGGNSYCRAIQGLYKID